MKLTVALKKSALKDEPIMEESYIIEDHEQFSPAELNEVN